MKNLIMALFILFPPALLSQSQFSIAVNGGTFFPNSSTFKLGVGGLISVDYHLTNDFTFYLTSGYTTWGYKNSNNYNTRIIPIIVGMKYKLFENSISPYLSSEFQYMTGEIDRLYHRPAVVNGSVQIVPVEKTINFTDYGVGLGAGISLPLNKNLSLDFGSSLLLTAKNSEIYNIRGMVGLSYNFN